MTTKLPTRMELLRRTNQKHYLPRLNAPNSRPYSSCKVSGRPIYPLMYDGQLTMALSHFREVF